jgi:hypothetical protein
LSYFGSVAHKVSLGKGLRSQTDLVMVLEDTRTFTLRPLSTPFLYLPQKSDCLP